MLNIDKLCFNCFHEKDNAGVCPYCGYNNTDNTTKFPGALSAGSVLNGQYVVGRVLGQGGFGITYLALDYHLELKVAVKEYLPEGMAIRLPGVSNVTVYEGEKQDNFQYGAERFLDEARVLAKFIGNKNIVSVKSYFRENNTAYFVMDYIEGINFKSYIKNHGGRINYQDALRILYPVAEALDLVHHEGVIHRDVTPDNIYITKINEIKLLDFGSARYSLGDKSKSLDVILKAGYAPKEQYLRKGKQGPYTDIYSLAACFYASITGFLPPEALERLDNDELVPISARGIQIPKHLETAILKGLAVRAENRYQSISEFKAELLSDAEINSILGLSIVTPKLVQTTAQQPIPAPMPAQTPVQQPIPVPMPIQTSVQQPIPTPMPVQKPVQKPVQQPIPAPMPAQTTAQQPIPAPMSIQTPVQQPIPAPRPVQTPLQQSIPTPVSTPVPTPLTVNIDVNPLSDNIPKSVNSNVPINQQISKIQIESERNASVRVDAKDKPILKNNSQSNLPNKSNSIKKKNKRTEKQVESGLNKKNITKKETQSKHNSAVVRFLSNKRNIVLLSAACILVMIIAIGTIAINLGHQESVDTGGSAGGGGGSAGGNQSTNALQTQNENESIQLVIDPDLKELDSTIKKLTDNISESIEIKQVSSEDEFTSLIQKNYEANVKSISYGYISKEITSDATDNGADIIKSSIVDGGYYVVIGVEDSVAADIIKQLKPAEDEIAAKVEEDRKAEEKAAAEKAAAKKAEAKKEAKEKATEEKEAKEKAAAKKIAAQKAAKQAAAKKALKQAAAKKAAQKAAAKKAAAKRAAAKRAAAEKCPYCHGTGKVECTWCDGTGKCKIAHWSKDKKEYIYKGNPCPKKITCPWCHGSGKKK